MNPIEEWQDAFENQVSGRTTVLNLASHYPYSPERWRLFVDGSRVFPEYGAVSQYTHTDDKHGLSPAAGETVIFESTERPRYTVQYELAATWAFATNQSLQGNDRIRVGLYDGSDGWYFEHRGDHADNEGDFVLERAGSEVYRKTNRDIHTPVTTHARLKIQTGWYDITRQIWERSYPDGGTQRNPEIGRFSADTARGSRTGNLPIHYEVTADASTSDLVFNAGSCAQVNLGTTTDFSRSKTAEFTTNVATTDTWVPIHAIRIDPAREIINTQLTNTDIVSFSGSGDIRVMPRAYAPEQLANGSGGALVDGDFSTPPEHSALNSVIESTTAVAEFPDATGTTGPSAANPGGYQLGFASRHSSGTGSKTQTDSGSATPKREVSARDVCVFLAKAEVAGDVTVEYITQQNW